MPDIQIQKTVVELSVEQLKANPWNRTQFDPGAMQDLVNSIKAGGIREPLIVRAKEGGYEIASGNRRWLAAKEAGLKEVPCLVQDLSDQQVAEMNLVSNVQREDLPPLVLAKMLQDYQDQFHVATQDDLARIVGKERTWVTKVMGLMSIPTVVADNVNAFTLGLRPALALKGLAPKHQKQVLQELKEGRLKPQHVEKRCKGLSIAAGMKAAKAKETPVSGADPGTAGIAAQTAVPGSEFVVSSSKNKNSKLGTTNSQQAVPAGIVGQLLQAGKNDLADQYLGQFGRVGGVLRTGLDKAWAAPKKKLFKWGLIFAAVSWLWHPVMRTLNYAFSRLMHLEVNQALAPISPRTSTGLAETPARPAVGEPVTKFTASLLTRVAAPTGLKAELMSGHKVHFTWQPVPGCKGYNFYSAYENLGFSLETNKPLPTAEALWRPSSGPAVYRIAVTAVDGEDHESSYSDPLAVDMR